MTCPSASILRLLSLALVALPLSLPSAAQAQWQRCASQDEVCRFEGQALVRYGAEGRYAFLVARNRVVCDVEAFGGDPAQGVVKQCDYSYDLNRRETSSSIPSRGWTQSTRPVSALPPPTLRRCWRSSPWRRASSSNRRMHEVRTSPAMMAISVPRAKLSAAIMVASTVAATHAIST